MELQMKEELDIDSVLSGFLRSLPRRSMLCGPLRSPSLWLPRHQKLMAIPRILQPFPRPPERASRVPSVPFGRLHHHSPTLLPRLQRLEARHYPHCASPRQEYMRRLSMGLSREPRSPHQVPGEPRHYLGPNYGLFSRILSESQAAIRGPRVLRFKSLLPMRACQLGM